MSLSGQPRITCSLRQTPQKRREAFGGVALASQAELDYRVSSNNVAFLRRNNSTRGSFLDALAKSMPMKNNGDNPFVRPNSPKTQNNGKFSSSLAKAGQSALLSASTSQAELFKQNYGTAASTAKSNYRKLFPQSHGKKSIFLAASFNNSNCASAQVSENGRQLAETYFKNERPLGGMPTLYKGETQFASTTYSGKKKLLS